MTDNANNLRAGYTFRLGGLKTIAGFTVSPSLTSDRINRAMDERFRAAHAAADANDQGRDCCGQQDMHAQCA